MRWEGYKKSLVKVVFYLNFGTLYLIAFDYDKDCCFISTQIGNENEKSGCYGLGYHRALSHFTPLGGEDLLKSIDTLE